MTAMYMVPYASVVQYILNGVDSHIAGKNVLGVVVMCDAHDDVEQISVTGMGVKYY